MKHGLTVTLVFEASSLNYGEGMGNISVLKHLTRADRQQYTYISRQALRYSMIDQLGWNNTPAEANGSGAKKVIQFQPAAKIDKYPEIDLFGYMKTEKGSGAKTRSAVVRLTNGISLEPFRADLDFLTNMGMAHRTGEDNAIAQSEQHRSFYSYTITIDLDRIGIDENDGISLPNDEKSRRVRDFLSCVEYLYRDIRGRRENLAPVFAVGGFYERKAPFFEGRVKLHQHKLDLEMLRCALEAAPEGTGVGYVTGTFENDAALREALSPLSIGKFFDWLRSEVEQAYAGDSN